MKALIFRFTTICLLAAAALTGCRSSGSEFLGRWVNTKNPSESFRIVRNGDEFLIVGSDQNPGVGAIYRAGTLEVHGGILSTNLTYVSQTDTILTPGFFGQVEFKRLK